MATWLIEAVGLLIGVVLTVLGFVFGIGRWLGQGLDHDYQRCPCQACNRRRQGVNRRTPYVTKTVMPFQRPSPKVVKSHWMSTRELHPGMKVSLQYRVYDVVDMRFDTQGWVVELCNQNTRRLFLVPVPAELADRKMWDPI
jgi:hypothetical protein